MNIPKERYTLDEAAEYLGLKKHDVRWLIEQGRLPATVVEDYRPTTNSLLVECYVKARDLEKFVNSLKAELDEKFRQHQKPAAIDVAPPIPESTMKLEEKRIKTEASKRATDARYRTRRVLLEKARGVAQQLWENGDTRLHHEMKRYLIEEYCDETGKYPFVNLPDKSLLDAVKNVAKDMGKLDLISGRKKSV